MGELWPTLTGSLTGVWAWTGARIPVFVPLLLVGLLCRHVGFPRRHWRAPDMEAVAIVVAGAITLVLGLQALQRIVVDPSRTYDLQADALGGIVMMVLGGRALQDGFERALREAPLDDDQDTQQ